ncbi:MAG TPA: RNA polymerase sigma factor [Terriglobia bacterium]|nr:RNA polymerase sigma factor [Terriglobia bacterium]
MAETLTVPVPMSAHEADADRNEDLALVQQYLAGDMRAFDALMIRHERQVYRACYRFVNNREDAMDLAQEVFIKAFENLASFRSEASFKTWIYRIAINHCINHVRKNAREFVEMKESTARIQPTVQADMEDVQKREQLRKLVKTLPPKQKAILELRIHEELSYEEIARMSGRSVSTIKATVFFALAKLRKLVGANAGGA